MSHWSRKQIWSTVVVLLVLIAALTGLNVLELRGEEPRRAVIAMEMLLSGDPVVLQLNGHPYLNKPPLYTYILALTFELLQSWEEWAVRLPGVLSYILLAGLSARWFAHYTGRITGFLTFLFLMSCWDMLFYGLVNAGEIDLFYALITFVQVMAIFHYEQKDRPLLLFIGSYAFMALACLTKGMPSLLFQGLTLLSWLAWRRKWNWLVTWQHLSGIAVAGLLIGGYFTLYAQREPLTPYIYNLVFESFDKSAGDSSPFEIIEGIFFFPLHLIKLTLPWSLLSILFLWKRYRKLPFDNPLISFALLFSLVNILPYWISPDSRGRYLYMFFPFLFLVLAHFWHNFKRPSYTRILGIAGATALLRIAYTIWIMPLQQDGTLKAGLIYRELNRDLLEQTGGQPINLYGRPDTIFWPDWLEYRNRNYILTPPVLPYQIPYYMSQSTGNPMKYDSIQPTSQYLLKYREDRLYDREGSILFRFGERLNGKEMELIKLRSDTR